MIYKDCIIDHMFSQLITFLPSLSTTKSLNLARLEGVTCEDFRWFKPSTSMKQMGPPRIKRNLWHWAGCTVFYRSLSHYRFLSHLDMECWILSRSVRYFYCTFLNPLPTFGNILMIFCWAKNIQLFRVCWKWCCLLLSRLIPPITKDLEQSIEYNKFYLIQYA